MKHLAKGESNKMNTQQRVIKPIISFAIEQGGINDENIERIMNNWNFMVSLKEKHCN